MRKNEPITKVMKTDVITVNDTESIAELRNIFQAHFVPCIPVIQEEILVGVVYWNDFMRFILASSEFDAANEHRKDGSQTATDLMTKEVVSVTRYATVRDAIRLLGIGEFHWIPVVENDGRLAGIVSTNDMLRFLAELD